MFTIGKDKTFIHCELFEEAASLTPNHLVTVLANDTGARWYVLGEAIRQEDGWIVPLQVVDKADARGIGTIRDFVVQENDTLA